MNNSFLTLENTEVLTEEKIDRTPWLRQREGEVAKIIQAMRTVAKSDDWSTLKTHIFEGVIEFLEKEMLSEAKKENPDTQKLASLKGQFVWAKKYADLDSLADSFSKELQNIKRQLHTSDE